MYWALTTLVTLGYGDITPYTNTEKIFTMLWMVAAMYALSFTVSSLSSMFSQSDIRRNQLTQKLAQVDEFVSESYLSKDIQSKMHNIITQNTEQRVFSVENKENLLNELPLKTRYEIAMNMYSGAIQLFNFFRDKDDTFKAKIMPLLQPLQVNALDMIYCIGENSTDIMFIIRGRCNYTFGVENQTFRVMQEGQHFGDIETVQKINRKYNVQAAIDSHMLVMSEKVITM